MKILEKGENPNGGRGCLSTMLTHRLLKFILNSFTSTGSQKICTEMSQVVPQIPQRK
jgi:hypothetical protein